MLHSKITQRKKATNINSTSHERDVPGLLERMLIVKMRANKKKNTASVFASTPTLCVWRVANIINDSFYDPFQDKKNATKAFKF